MPRRSSRIEPHADLIPEGMGSPEWERYGVTPNAQQQKVGDPTRWGAQVLTTIPAAGLVDSAQVLAIATRDQYARSWSLLGTLGLTAEMWNSPGVGPVGCTITLDVAMGVGQAQVVHRIVLFDNAAPGGLCYTQYILQGGPYNQIPALPVLVRPFAVIGGLIGQSVNIRVNYSVNAAFAGLPLVSPLVLIAAPYAAGEGL